MGTLTKIPNSMLLTPGLPVFDLAADYGAVNNGSDTTSAFNLAKADALSAGGGIIYLAPGGSWKGNWEINPGEYNIHIRGGGQTLSGALAQYSTFLTSYNTSKPALALNGKTDGFGSVEIGCSVADIGLWSGGLAGVFGLLVYQPIWCRIANVTVFGGARYVGAAQVITTNFAFYGNSHGDPALRLDDEGATREGNGPCVFLEGEVAGQNGGGGHALEVAQDGTAVTFGNILFEATAADAVITLDGSGQSGFDGQGDIKFSQCHTESCWSSDNNGAQILVGSSHKFGTVIIDGGSWYMQGNGTNYMRDWIRLVDGRNVTIDSVRVTKGGSTHGGNRAAIRIESTFAGKLDVRNVDASDIVGTMYSDARASGAIPSGYVGDYCNNPKFFGGVPTSDPHIAGEVWSNSGVLTISAG